MNYDYIITEQILHLGLEQTKFGKLLMETISVTFMFIFY